MIKKIIGLVGILVCLCGCITSSTTTSDGTHIINESNTPIQKESIQKESAVDRLLMMDNVKNASVTVNGSTVVVGIVVKHNISKEDAKNLLNKTVKLLMAYNDTCKNSDFIGWVWNPTDKYPIMVGAKAASSQSMVYGDEIIKDLSSHQTYNYINVVVVI